ncbi:MAG: hypothetical protein Q8L85_06670 [Alphaproteobacteria bacterium]|nr:hypothetical protein [Alphaproteobacteria bacterium]
MKRILLSTMLLAAVSANVFAGGTQDMGAHQQPVQHAEPAVMPAQAMPTCEGPALKEGQWTLTARAGIAPTSSKKARITRTYTGTTPNQVVTFPVGHQDITDVNGFDRRSYNVKSNSLPFTTGFDVGYAVMDNVEAFFNFDYTHASGSSKTIDNKFDGITSISKYKQGNFNSYGFYLGGRYFFDLDCKFSPFVGAKLGLIHRTHGKHSIIDTNIIYGITSIERYNAPLYKNSTGFSAGLQLGGDYCLNEQVSLFVMGEVIGSTSVKTHKKTHLAYRETGTGSNHTVFTKVTRSPKSTFSFPITAGLKVRM